MSAKKTKYFVLFSLLSFLIFYCKITSAQTFQKSESNSSKVLFSENKGQIHDQFYNPRKDILFSGKSGELNFFLRKNGISYQTILNEKQKGLDSNNNLRIYRTDIHWLDYNENFEIKRIKPNDSFKNYYLPSCPEGALNVKSFEEIVFQNLFSGIDIRWYNNKGYLEYDFIVNPYSDIRSIKWKVSGAVEVYVNNEGRLIIHTPFGFIEEDAPIAFQDENEVKVSWRVEDDIVSFNVGNYEKDKELVIDPMVRLWGTYYGGNNRESNFVSSYLDGNGDLLVLSNTQSTSNIATVGSHMVNYAGGGQFDAFLVKFNSSGTLLWGTYYGGLGNDEGQSICSNKNNEIFITGGTHSTAGFTTAGSFQPSNAGSSDAFIVKFNSNGVRQWGTYYGGAGNERGNSIEVDSSGSIYVGGITTSSFGISNGNIHQSNYGGVYDGFLLKLTPNGNRTWCTYYGGNNSDFVTDISIDINQNIYISGNTKSTNGISSPNSHMSSYGGGQYDGFIAKFRSNGTRLWGTYYGGNGNYFDYGESCGTDSKSSVYLIGYTNSPSGIATNGSHQASFGGANDCYIAKFDSLGIRIWSTYFGGSMADNGRDCSIDSLDNVYVSGRTESLNAISTANAHQTNFGGGNTWDGFIVKFNSAGVRKASSYYGSTGSEDAYSCSADRNRFVYIAGSTQSLSNISTSNSHQSNYGGGLNDIFIAKFDGCSSFKQIATSICSNDSLLTAGNQLVTSPGIYLDTLISFYGCDSIIETTVIAYPVYFDQLFDTVCNNSNYLTVGGQVVQNSGIYIDTLKTINFCDSIIESNIFILPQPSLQQNISICDNDSFASLSGKFLKLTGTYFDTLTSVLGCDSIIQTNLNTYPTFQKIINDTICQGQTYISIGGKIISTSGSYYDTLSSNSGCDSSFVTNIQVIESTLDTLKFDTCFGIYSINGKFFDSSGLFSDTVINNKGCDSIIYYKLQLKPLDNTVSVDFSKTPSLLVSNEMNSKYQWLSCDLGYSKILGQNSQSFSALTDGEYSVEVSRGACVDTSSCLFVSVLSAEDNRFPKHEISVFPNPTNSWIYLNTNSYYHIIVFDFAGKVVLQDYSNSINLRKLSRGPYLLNIIGINDSYRYIILKN